MAPWALLWLRSMVRGSIALGRGAESGLETGAMVAAGGQENCPGSPLKADWCQDDGVMTGTSVHTPRQCQGVQGTTGYSHVLIVTIIQLKQN